MDFKNPRLTSLHEWTENLIVNQHHHVLTPKICVLILIIRGEGLRERIFTWRNKFILAFVKKKE